MSPFLPPIMQTPGLRLVAIGERDGKPFLKFSTAGDEAGVREVVLFVKTRGPIQFVYSTYDKETHTTISYAGPHGDMEKDTIVGDITAFLQ